MLQRITVRPDSNTKTHAAGSCQAWCFSPYGTNGKKFRDENARAKRLLGELGVERVFVPDARWAQAQVAPLGTPLMPIRDFPRETLAGAEAAWLTPGDGFAGYFGGCIAFVAESEAGVIAGHAGRDSLINRARVQGRESGYRKHEGILDAVAEAFYERAVPTERVRLYGFFGIRVEMYLHPLFGKYAEYNRRLGWYIQQQWRGGIARSVAILNREARSLEWFLQLDLGALFCAQARKLGFGEVIYRDPIALKDGFPSTRDTGREKDRSLVAIKYNR
jgi:hypothetical protein